MKVCSPFPPAKEKKPSSLFPSPVPIFYRRHHSQLPGRSTLVSPLSSSSSWARERASQSRFQRRHRPPTPLQSFSFSLS